MPLDKPFVPRSPQSISFFWSLFNQSTHTHNHTHTHVHGASQMFVVLIVPSCCMPWWSAKGDTTWGIGGRSILERNTQVIGEIFEHNRLRS